MHKSQRVLGQIGRTLFNIQKYELNIQAQQKLVTLCCGLTTSSPVSVSVNDNDSRKSSSSRLLPAQNYSKFTAARENLPISGAQLIGEERAFDLVSNLKETELAAIKLALKKYDAKQQKENFEGKLQRPTNNISFSTSKFGQLPS